MDKFSICPFLKTFKQLDEIVLRYIDTVMGCWVLSTHNTCERQLYRPQVQDHYVSIFQILKIFTFKLLRIWINCSTWNKFEHLPHLPPKREYLNYTKSLLHVPSSYHNDLIFFQHLILITKKKVRNLIF